MYASVQLTATVTSKALPLRMRHILISNSGQQLIDAITLQLATGCNESTHRVLTECV